LSPSNPPLIAASPTVTVSNSNDSGPSSFRDAINQANTDPEIKYVQFHGHLGTIELDQTIWFTGPQDLTINGAGATLDGAGIVGLTPPLKSAFLATGGGDLTVVNLKVHNAPGEGITVDVPHTQTGTVRVSLINVEIENNVGHGVLVDDQDNPATIELDGDSVASVDVTVTASHFFGNGASQDSASDRDGLRVNEGGVGDLKISATLSSFEENGADGIEVDEKGAGDVRVNMFGCRLTANGPRDTTDLDDGFDIDEAGDGSVLGNILLSSANDNFEQGFDFNENDSGDIRVDMLLVEASRNNQEGIEYEEDDDVPGGGDIVAAFDLIKANGNKAGDAGFKVREKGAGNLDVTVRGIETSNNLIGGIHIREDAVGTLTSSITRASALGNAGHGIDFDENRLNAADASGAVTAAVSNSTSSNNTGAGVRADSQTPNAGTLTLTNVTLLGNAGGETTGNNVVVTTVP
jgi:hypothetical protein